MDPVTTVASVFSIGKTLVDSVSTLKEAGATLTDAERNMKLVDLMRVAYSAEERLYCLSKENRELKEQLAFRSKMNFEAPFYFQVSEGIKSGPFCACCYDSKSKEVRLFESSPNYWECKNCKNYYDPTANEKFPVAMSIVRGCNIY